MHRSLENILLWSPRVLGAGVALFFGLFALDAFGGGESFLHALPDFFIHLVPAFLMLIVVALSWRRPWIGGVVFIALAVTYAASVTRLSWIVTIGGPLLVVGLLFLASWWRTRVTRRNALS